MGQAKAELEERLAAIDELLHKEDGNVLEGSDGEEFEEVSEEWDEYSVRKEEGDLEEAIDDATEPTEEEREESVLQKRYNRMTWRELLRETRKVAYDEYIAEEQETVREAVKQQFLLLKKVMKGWNSSAVKSCFLAWGGWAKSTRETREHADNAERKARELQEEAAAARKELEDLEISKWEEGWDEFTERVTFTHAETGELVYDEMPKRGELLGRNLYNRK